MIKPEYKKLLPAGVLAGIVLVLVNIAAVSTAANYEQEPLNETVAHLIWLGLAALAGVFLGYIYRSKIANSYFVLTGTMVFGYAASILIFAVAMLTVLLSTTPMAYFFFYFMGIIISTSALLLAADWFVNHVKLSRTHKIILLAAVFVLWLAACSAAAKTITKAIMSLLFFP
jgi:hypothetical protein